MKIEVRIDNFLIRRGASVPDKFFHTDSPIALVFKPIFGRSFSIHDPYIWWEDVNGRTHNIALPSDALNWLSSFYYSTLEQRLQFNGIKFDVTIPTSQLTGEIAENLYTSKYITAPYLMTPEYWKELKFWEHVN